MKIFKLQWVVFFTLSLLLFQSVAFSATVLQLRGHLDQELLTKEAEKLPGIAEGETLFIELQSASGDLLPALELARKIYALKAQKKTQVIIYIEDQAIGPAAIFPFLADSRFISYFVSWGDIPYGNVDLLPAHLLRSRVSSLVDLDQPKASMLQLMAEAMSDPALTIINGKDWKIGNKQDHQDIVSKSGETLVLNHNELQKLGLITEVLSPSNFQKKFGNDKKTEIKETKESTVSTAKSLDKSLQDHIKFKTEGENIVGYISIDNRTSGINRSTWLYVKQALDYYKKQKPIFIILNLDTPGGEVYASQKISDALKEMDTQFDIPCVAVINNWAISAGAMLAYSCRYITTVKDGSMGAAEPVTVGESGKMETASEKVNSALRSDFASRAAFFGRNSEIAEAMVDKDIILVLRHGKIIKLDDEDQIRKTGPNPDKIITNKGKLLTLNASQMNDYQVADRILLPVKIDPITDQEKEKGSWPANKMLLFTTSFFQSIPAAVIKEYKPDWKTHFFVLITHPMVTSLLFLGMLMGFYVEINTPGFGIPGSVALFSLCLLVLSSFALEAVQIFEPILMAAGMILLALDLFVIPSFGIIGILGIVFMIIGLFGMLLPGIDTVSFDFDSQTLNAAGEVFFQRLAWLSATLVLGVILMAILGRYVMPSFQAFQRFVLKGHEQEKKEGYFAGRAPSTLPQVGVMGIVTATLRPAGKIQIKDEIFDAVTSGEFIEKDEKIVVSELQGSVIVVEKIS